MCASDCSYETQISFRSVGGNKTENLTNFSREQAALQSKVDFMCDVVCNQADVDFLHCYYFTVVSLWILWFPVSLCHHLKRKKTWIMHSDQDKASIITDGVLSYCSWYAMSATVVHYALVSLHSGQHWLQHQDGNPEDHSTAHKELFWRSPDESLQPDEKGFLPQVPPLWHLSACHQEERPGGHHVSQKVTLLCLQREGRGHHWTLGLVTHCQRSSSLCESLSLHER